LACSSLAIATESITVFIREATEGFFVNVSVFIFCIINLFGNGLRYVQHEIVML
jgi:hypothetical protein